VAVARKRATAGGMGMMQAMRLHRDQSRRGAIPAFFMPPIFSWRWRASARPLAAWAWAWAWAWCKPRGFIATNQGGERSPPFFMPPCAYACRPDVRDGCIAPSAL